MLSLHYPKYILKLDSKFFSLYIPGRKIIFSFFSMIFFLIFSGCTDGKINSSSMGLTNDGFSISQPLNGIKKVRFIQQSFTLSGQCSSDVSGFEISFDNTHFLDLVSVGENPQLDCIQNGVFTISFTHFKDLVKKGYPTIDLDASLNSEISFSLRAFNESSISKVQKVRLVPFSSQLTSLTLINPTAHISDDTTPTFRTSEDLDLNDSVTIYKDNQCSNPISSTQTLYLGTYLDIELFPLVTQTTYSLFTRINDGPCSESALENYTLNLDSLNPILGHLINAPNSIIFNWSEGTDVDYFSLMKKIGDNWQSIPECSTLPSSTLSCTLTGISANNSVDYKLIAHLKSGPDLSSNIISAKTMDPITNYQAKINGEKISFSWNSVAGANSYQIIKGINDGVVLASIDATPGGALSYDRNLNDFESRKIYVFRVVAKNNSPGNIKSDLMSITTPAKGVLDTSFNHLGFNMLFYDIENKSSFSSMFNTIAINSNGKIFAGGTRFSYSDANQPNQLQDSAFISSFDKNGSLASSEYHEYSSNGQTDQFLSLDIDPFTPGVLAGGVINSLSSIALFDFSIEIVSNFWESSSNTLTFGLSSIYQSPSKIVRVLADANGILHSNLKYYSCETLIQGANEYSSSVSVHRYNYDGTKDTSYANSGRATISLPESNTVKLYDCNIDSQNRIYLLGKGYFASLYGSIYQMVVIRLNPDGTVDTNYSNSQGLSYVQWDDGRGNNDEWPNKLIFYKRSAEAEEQALIIGHISDASAAQTVPFLALLKGTGALDETFGNNISTEPGIWCPVPRGQTTLGTDYSQFSSAIVDSENPQDIYITGWLNDAETGRDLTIWKFNLASQGTLDTRFGSNGLIQLDFGDIEGLNDKGVDLAINPITKSIIVVGQTNQSSDGIHSIPIILSIK